MSDKYFYIAVPQEQFHEVKHTFYEAPSSYLKVYNGDYIRDLEQQVTQLQQLADKQKAALEEIDATGFGYVQLIACQALGKEVAE